MSFFYAEIKEGKVASLGNASSTDYALESTEGLVVELTEKEYDLLRACKGDIESGIYKLQRLSVKIADAVLNNLDDPIPSKNEPDWITRSREIIKKNRWVR